MKKLITLVITSFVLISSVIYGADHKGKKELELMASMAGKYTYEYARTGESPMTGKIEFKLFGDGHFLIADETFDMNDPDSIGVIGITGYDKIDGVFTWYRVFSNGAYDHGRGRLKNGTITFNITKTRLEPMGDRAWDGPGIKLRTKWTDFSDDGWSFIWERSKDGGPWEEMGRGRNAKVK